MQNSVEKLSPRRRRFVEAFAQLWRAARAAGIQKPRVGRQAALDAGYGDGSWCEQNRIQTADVIYNRLIKVPEVLKSLEEVGLVRNGRGWKERH